MKFDIVFSVKAIDDIKEAKRWYNAQQKNLGSRFLNDIKSTIRLVSKQPKSFATRYGQIRMAVCKVFPYAIHFEIDSSNNLIRVISVFHFSRRPFWLDEGQI